MSRDIDGQFVEPSHLQGGRDARETKWGRLLGIGWVDGIGDNETENGIRINTAQQPLIRTTGSMPMDLYSQTVPRFFLGATFVLIRGTYSRAEEKRLCVRVLIFNFRYKSIHLTNESSLWCVAIGISVCR